MTSGTPLSFGILVDFSSHNQYLSRNIEREAPFVLFSFSLI
jgi:hypothetical protein